MRNFFRILFAAICFNPQVCLAVKAEALWPEKPAAVAKPLPGDLLQVTVHRLDNGLTVYMSPNPQEPRVSAWIAVRAGAVRDPADSTGMAHYLEHMLFKGTESLGTLDYEKEAPHLYRILELYERLFDVQDPSRRAEIYAEIDRENIAASEYSIPNEFDKLYRQMGFSGVNAFTGNEEVVYICTFPRNRADVWAKVEADRFARPVFRLFQTEIETVYEEKNMSLDRPESIIYEALEKRLFGEHPYGRTVLGSIEHLKNPSLKKMYEYYGAYYVPNNMCIALAGDFDRRKMLSLVKKRFGSWKAKPLPAPQKAEIPSHRGVERVEVSYEAEEKVIASWLLPHNRHPDAPALRVMDMLMDNSVSGIINLTLNQAQKVKSSGSFAWIGNEAGYFAMIAVPKTGQTLEQAEALLLECVEKLKKGEFSSEDIAAIITNFEVSEKRRLESNDERVGVMAYSYLNFKEWKETVEDLDRLRRVTKEDVLRVAGKYLGQDRVVAYRRNAKPELPQMAKPEFTKIDIDVSRQSGFFAEVAEMPAKPIPPRWLKEGNDYVVRDMPWGRLYAGPNPVNDLFVLHFGIKFGEMHEPKLGPAMKLLSLAGAGDMSAEEFKKKLYALGASLNFGSNERWVYVRLEGLDANLEDSIDLLAELFGAPNIEAGTLEKMVEVAVGAHQDNKRNPGYIFYALGQLAQRGSESQVLAELSDQELAKLQTKELVDIVVSIPDYPWTVCYVGNRSAEEVSGMLYDNRTRHARPPPTRRIRYQKPEKNRILFTHRDMVQSQVGIFAADGTLDPGKEVDYQFLRNYLGGGMSSVIFQEIREARAMAYSAWGWYYGGHWKGDENLLYGRLSTQADKTIEATQLLRDLLRDPPLSEERFAETAKAIEESYRTQPVGFRDAPFAAMRWEEQGISGGDPRPEWFARALKYRLQDLREFTERMKEKPMSVYILGNRERVDMAKLKELGDFQELTLDQIFPY